VKGSGGLSGTDLPVLTPVGLILLAGVLFGGGGGPHSCARPRKKPRDPAFQDQLMGKPAALTGISLL